jgi:hypothetical protein
MKWTFKSLSVIQPSVVLLNVFAPKKLFLQKAIQAADFDGGATTFVRIVFRRNTLQRLEFEI